MRLLNKLLGSGILFFISGSIYSQVVESSFVEKFNNYNNKTLQEKLFVHTDKEFYVAGEILWFKVYYVSGTSHKPLNLSKVAYLEIFNEKEEPVLQAKVSLKTGESDGSFYLPVSLNTGNYTIRAYTNWMKNFREEFFFEKRVTIINTLKEPEQVVAKDSSLLNVAVSFFPEGGNLVNGIESRVGFSIVNKDGGLDNCQGFIVNNNDDTIAQFAPLKYGLGNFSYTPQSGSSYKAKIVLPGGIVITKDLPRVYDNGYVMKVTDNGQQQIVITVKRKRMQGEQSVGRILLATHTRQVLKITETASLNDNDSVRFVIDKGKLDKGVTHFTLFADNSTPVCERLVYIKPDQQISVSIQAGSKEYSQRQKIDLSLNVAGKTQPLLNLSASVFYADGLQKEAPSNIINYMWLASDIPGLIESPDFYFSNDPVVPEATDNLMLTHGWRRFNWENVLKGDNSFVKYLPEIDGHLVTGQITDSRSGKPVSGINASLTVPGRPFGFYTAGSDANGTIRFNIRNYYGNGQVIAQRGIGVDSFYAVNILKPFAEKFVAKQYPEYKLTEDIKQQMLKRSIGMQTQNVYIGDSMRNFKSPSISDSLPFYGLPEKSYKLDDYKRFTTMEEVLREYVLEIGVTLRNGKPNLIIFNPEAHDFYSDYELVLLDGVMLHDINKIFSYDPLKVKKLDIFQTRYIHGQSVFNGVASFSTYEGKFDGYELDPKIVAIDYAGLQLQREFYSPLYETKEQLESRIPDFRSTLFWAPDIRTNAEGKAALQFYSSDRSGTYLVVLQGMNENGDFIYATTTFEVK